jgi:hypothetical protein
MRVLYSSLLQQPLIQQPDGLVRLEVRIPVKSEILHLGIVTPIGQLGIVYLTEPPLTDPTTKKPIPPPLATLEFIAAMPGQEIPVGYQYRGAVRAEGTPPTYIFQRVEPERAPNILVMPTSRI